MAFSQAQPRPFHVKEKKHILWDLSNMLKFPSVKVLKFIRSPFLPLLLQKYFAPRRLVLGDVAQ